MDNFAGGGGASTGIEMAIGRSVDIAINHDPAAIAMHRANHPTTEHYQEDVWKVNPVKACAGRPVALAWFSPDCKHHSRAKGGKPVSRHIRGLAWVAVKWAKAVHPRIIMLENVEEFQDWGRLDKDNRPDPRYKGETFRRFVSQLERQGYKVEYRTMRACDYGAPTIRKRFFLIARCDGKPIVWPEPTHAAPDSFEALAGMKKPWVPVADVLDFNLPCPSIFATSEEIFKQYGIHAVRPLSEKTMRRIARGIEKFVLKNPSPFIIQVNHGGENFRGQDIEEPLSVDHSSAGTDKFGQVKLIRDASVSIQDEAREKRESLNVRVAKMAEIVNSAPEDHFILWHDLESERHAIKDALPEAVEVYGTQDLDERERRVVDFSEGRTRLLATKKEISGQGCNFQRYCHRAIFLGIDYKFNDFIQAVHRIYRFLQTEEVVIDIIYVESEAQVKEALLKKWRQHEELQRQMVAIVKKYGLHDGLIMERMCRSMGVERLEICGERYKAVRADCVEETARMEDNSVDLRK